MNRFDKCYRDAKRLEDVIRNRATKRFTLHLDTGTFLRASAVLYVASLEALINRVAAAFLPPLVARLVESDRRGLPHAEKWAVVPLLAGAPAGLDQGAEPWQSFRELIAIRNDLVHPPADSEEFAELFDVAPGEPDFDWPSDQPSYPHTGLARDSEAWGLSDIERIRRTVDLMIGELQRLLPTKVTSEWLHGEERWEDAPCGARGGGEGKSGSPESSGPSSIPRRN